MYGPHQMVTIKKGKLLTRDVVRRTGETDDELQLTDKQWEKYDSLKLTSKALSEQPNESKKSKKKRKRVLQRLLEPSSDDEDIEPEEQKLREKLISPILTQPNLSTTVEDLGLNLNDLPDPILENDEGVAQLDEVDPRDNASSIESTEAVNDMLSPALQTRDIGGAHLEEIIGHEFDNSQLRLKTLWSTGEDSSECIKDMKVDHTKNDS